VEIFHKWSTHHSCTQYNNSVSRKFPIWTWHFMSAIPVTSQITLKITTSNILKPVTHGTCTIKLPPTQLLLSLSHTHTHTHTECDMTHCNLYYSTILHCFPCICLYVGMDTLLNALFPFYCFYLCLKGWTIGWSGFEFRCGLGIFLFNTVSRLALGPTQPPIQWIPGALSLGVKWSGCEIDHSPPSSAKVKECVELYLHSPNMPSWHGAQLRKSTRTTLLLLLPVYKISEMGEHSLHSWELNFSETLTKGENQDEIPH
jgi:hypothetical protein